MTDPLSPEEIEELRQLRAQATPGRWHKYQTGIGEFICGVAPGRGNAVYADTPGGTRPSADLSLIVAAHSALPRLLDITEDHARLVAENDKLRARDQRIRELAAATGEAQRFQLEARFETKLDCLLDAIEETP